MEPFKISANAYLAAISPCVYAWVRGFDPMIYLYIGCSPNGLYRLFNHNIINTKELMQPEDQILIWHTTDYIELEHKLISQHKPKYNLSGLLTIEEKRQKDIASRNRTREEILAPFRLK